MRQHRNGRAGRSRPRAPADSAPIGPAHDDLNAEDSGGDFFRRSADRRAEQKARQLCRQVYRTLSLALPGCGDETLQDLTVLTVDPAPDAGHLLVTVAAAVAAEPAAAAGGESDRSPVTVDVHERLARATGRLRAEVARDIVRKRAPELSFRVLYRAEVTP